MERIKLMTDTAGDIPEQALQEHDITVMSIPITIDGEGIFEREGFTNQDFYKMMSTARSIPVTSHVTSVRYLEAYEECYAQGYQHLVNVTINSLGSNMYSAATMARNMFFEAHPGARGRFEIYVVDSMSYCTPYGYAVVQAAKMAEQQATIREVLAYLEDFFSRLEIYFSVYTLEYAKRSGRISCAAAFVGDMLGLRPIMSIIDGEIKIIEKVRGDKNVAAKLAQYTRQRIVPGGDYLVIEGSLPEPPKELAQILTKELGRKPIQISTAGASIAINAGPKVVGVLVKGAKKR